MCSLPVPSFDGANNTKCMHKIIYNYVIVFTIMSLYFYAHAWLMLENVNVIKVCH